MASFISIPQDISVSSPLGALIAHFNSSSKNVQKEFAKLLAENNAMESLEKLAKKIERGEAAIRNGQGISQKPNETTEDFIERLCTM